MLSNISPIFCNLSAGLKKLNWWTKLEGRVRWEDTGRKDALTTNNP